MHCFTSYCQNINDVPSTGELEESDTAVMVSINDIRKANAIMIERKYLANIVNEQDSIILYYKDYTIIQDSIIKDFQDKLVMTNEINENLRKQYEKERVKKIIFGTTAGAFAATTLVCILISSLK